MDNAIDWSFGKIGFSLPMGGANTLNGPYDAKMIGDYTGITPPKVQKP